MWATRLRCPSCPQRGRRCRRLDPCIGDKALPCARASRERWCRGQGPLQGRQHAGEDLEPQIILVAQAVGAALDHPNLVVEPFNEAKRHLVLQPAVGGDAVPMTIDQLGKLLVGLEPLPFQARAPILKEASRPALAFVAPQLIEALLEDIGRVEPLVGRSSAFNAFLPSSVRFSLRDSNVYF